MQEKKVNKASSGNKSNEGSGEPNLFWSLAENFLKNLFSQLERKIQAGTEEVAFFLKKKVLVFFLIFFGSGLLLVGVALALEKALAFWGLAGWGWILAGGLTLLLAGGINKIKK